MLDSFDKLFPLDFNEYDFTDKKQCIKQHVLYMINKCQSMFEWRNLPETISQRNLELLLQINGFACFYKVKEELYAFFGGLGGELDPYYMPTICTIANPALNLSVQAHINNDCIIVPNDSMYVGLYPLFVRYASMMCENEISMYVALINSRIVDLLSASDDRTKTSAEKFIEDIKSGKLSVIAESELFEKDKSLFTAPYGTTGTHVLTDIIEHMQYEKASFYNEIGLNANYNMKRESLNSAESQMNNDALLPLIDDMLRARQIGAEKVNAMFGTNIQVDFASAWEDNAEEIEIEHDALENENSSREESDGNNEGVKDDENS